MLEFVNDPLFDGVPLVGAGHVLVAERRSCGRAARWLPGGDVVALAEFLGPEYPVLDGQVYFRQADRSLLPLDLSRPALVIVPPAGDVKFNEFIGLFPQQYAQVVEVDAAKDEAKPVKVAAKKAAASSKG